MSSKSKTKVTIVLNSEGVQELLKSDAIQGQCMSLANAAVSSLGAGYSAAKRNYPERSGAIVKATTYEAAKENSENETIQKAVFHG